MTSRFTIRPYRLEDVAEVYAAADESREHIGKWMSWMTPGYSENDAQSWVAHAGAAWKNEAEFQHVIIDANDHSIVGSCGLNRLNRIVAVCILGYWVRASRLGEGAARQATLLLREFGFQTLSFNRLEIVVAVGNLPSQRVAESVGAQFEGVQRKRLRVGEVPHDARMHAFINESAKNAATP
jgi:ribosomal-protein-serine acetyltransferase